MVQEGGSWCTRCFQLLPARGVNFTKSYGLVLEGSEGEGEGWELLVKGGEELSSELGLQVEVNIKLSLEDGDSVVRLLWLSISA